MIGHEILGNLDEIGIEVQLHRLERRLERVLRQLDVRITEIEQLRRELTSGAARAAELEGRLDEATREANQWRENYRRLMATKTYRTLRIPRTLYARFVRLLRRDSPS